MSERPRVALVDDDNLILEHVGKALETNGLDVVWRTTSGAEALRLARDPSAPSVDVIAVDVRMPEMNGFDLTEILVGEFPGIAVVLMSSIGDEVAIATAAACGAIGYLEKPRSIEVLARVLRSAAAGIRSFPELPEGWRIPGETARLTSRELEVLGLLSRHLENSEIAKKLYISPHTVKRHVTSVCAKLRVKNREAAVREGRELGLLRRYWPDETERPFRR